ncbi:MAG: efflux RND transporter periplasmic adaptor subunit [Gemmataceae bacterium]
MSTRVDLSQLAVQRDAPAAAPSAARRRVVTRYALPGLLLAGFAALVAYAVRETLSPPRPVTVIPVTTSQQGMDAPADAPLFRAAGWAEPRPTPTIVTALAEGVVEQLLVVEGQEVKPGQVIARLAAGDARLALEAAEAEVELRDGELVAAGADPTAARARLDRPHHLRAVGAEAAAALAKAESELAALPAQRKGAEARQAAAKRDWDYRRGASDVVPAASLARSKAEFDAATSSLEELQTRQKRIPVEIAALKQKHDAVEEKLQRKVEETRQLAQAEAGAKVAAARLRQARAARDAAGLRLERMEVRSPVGGRVLTLVARPGTRLTGLNAGSLHDSSTVLTLYDPASLQVRVDVRLDDVAKVQPGQKARVETAALPNQPLDGEMLLATSQADVQKNTLSVKVAVRNPPQDLKPDMLCQVTFLAPPRSSAGTAGMTRMLVPKQLVEAGGLWVVDQLSGTARFREVELGLTSGDLVEVVRGLASSDKLIVAGRDGLKEGARVRVVGEDETLGLTPIHSTATKQRSGEPRTK